MQCHRTADICENALELCEKPLGPRTRRCHLRYRACKSRFSHLHAKKVNKSRTTSLTTKYVFVVALKGNNESLSGLQSELTHSRLTDLDQFTKSVNLTMNVKFIDFGDESFNLTVQAQVPLNLKPIEALIDDPVWMKFAANDKLELFNMIGQTEKSEELKLAIRNTSEYSRCIAEPGNEDSPDCRFVIEKATSMDRVRGTVIGGWVGQNEFYQKWINLVNYRFLSDFQFDHRNLTELEDVQFEIQCDMYGRKFNSTIQLPTFNITRNEVPVPEEFQGLVPVTMNRLSTEPWKDNDSESSSDLCQINSGSAETFNHDNVSYSVNDCLHLLFKDCSGQLPFAVLGRKISNSSEDLLTLQVLAGPISVILDPVLINGSRKMSIILNVQDLKKELILTPEQILQGQVHIEKNLKTGLTFRINISNNLYYPTILT